MDNLTLKQLRAKQSVRVTFKLSPETIVLLRSMAGQLGIRQKTLFDQLIAASDLMAGGTPASPGAAPEPQRRRQKTFVLSQETVDTLNQLARRHNVPRNLLVEMFIHRLRPILAEEQERHGLRRQLLPDLAQQTAAMADLQARARRLLGSDDPLTREVSQLSQAAQAAQSRIMAIVAQGESLADL
ncbi:MAG: hypothetical protein ABFR97_03185 [Thermodesulfobacteriota bacterium]